MNVIIPNNHYMPRTVHVEEIDQVHEYDSCDNPMQL